MPDIRLVQRTDFPYRTEVSADWLLLDDGTLDETQALATAVIVALGTDRFAEPSDILPDPDSTDRRGWWGDLDADVIWGGWPIGSRLWLLHRSKIAPSGAQEGSMLIRVKQYIQEAIQPFIDLRLASSMEVIVSRVDTQRIDALIRLYRGPKVAIELQYQVLWDDIQP
jgi:phage gp46-like protein